MSMRWLPTVTIGLGVSRRVMTVGTTPSTSTVSEGPPTVPSESIVWTVTAQ